MICGCYRISGALEIIVEMMQETSLYRLQIQFF